MILRSSLWLPIRSLQESIRPQWHDASRSSLTLLRNFTFTPSQNAKTKIGARAHRHKRLKDRTVFRDPYTIRLAEAKKASAIARQQALTAERVEAKGDPIHGGPQETPFVHSLKLAMNDDEIHIPNTEDGSAPSKPPDEVKLSLTSQDEILSPGNTGVAAPTHLNDFLSPADLARFTSASRDLTRPQPALNRNTADPQKEDDARQKHALEHASRSAALARIFAVENTSGRQRQRINTTRMVEELGRHVTDDALRPRVDREGNALPKKERVGPDTGSSEVQIGILTSKIKVLAAAYAGTARNDKANKRNLRLLLHRRAKLLKYFQRKDRGGDRWRHLIEKLGLTPATWEGEIEVR